MRRSKSKRKINHKREKGDFGFEEAQQSITDDQMCIFTFDENQAIIPHPQNINMETAEEYRCIPTNFNDDQDNNLLEDLVNIVESQIIKGNQDSQLVRNLQSFLE